MQRLALGYSPIHDLSASGFQGRCVKVKGASSKGMWGKEGRMWQKGEITHQQIDLVVNPPCQAGFLAQSTTTFTCELNLNDIQAGTGRHACNLGLLSPLNLWASGVALMRK